MQRPTLTQRLWTFARTSTVGLFATLCDLTMLFLLIHVAGMSDELANVPSLLPGMVVMFFGTKYFAFEDRSRHVVKQGGRFLFVEAWAVAINAMLYHLLVRETGLQYMLARMLGTFLVYVGFSFPFWTFIFRKTPLPAEQPA